MKKNFVKDLGDAIRGKNTGVLKNVLAGPNRLAPKKALPGGPIFKPEKMKIAKSGNTVAITIGKKKFKEHKGMA